jgi:hypothetical protein
MEGVAYLGQVYGIVTVLGLALLLGPGQHRYERRCTALANGVTSSRRCDRRK